LAALLVLVPATARADEPITRVGVTAVIGGGITGFTDSAMRDAAGAGLAWNARVAIGSRLPVALELGYVGTGTTLTGMGNATLEGETLDVALRYAVMPRASWTPYALVGIGSRSYHVVGASWQDMPPGMWTTERALVVPASVGVQLRDGRGIVLDVRGTYRASQGAGMNAASMDAWEATLSLGAEL
jgi:hypothetical protein